ncbi:MAG TPA: bifunctional hydroxymethylpyrimidine kinase/phosphomethylpyrimidine kinase [Candidatus Angelobacter sp.]|nr:bifunctional hydroxymethylpyrimidine kinase/phosphomethylpyrimidine kinase [Candidatus Angelobacter sp.]
MAHRKKSRLPVVLSIAGHDPSSGAGSTADIKTIAAHGCYGVTCITALTVQSTRGVVRMEPVQGKTITETLETLVDDLNIAAVKIGMIGSAEAAQAIAAFLERHSIPNVVLDPIVKSSSGADLISQEGLQIMKTRLLSQAHVITPNIDEATTLTGMAIANPAEMEAAALSLQKSGAKNVIITGGHLDPPYDLVCHEGQKPIFLKGRKIKSRSTHGTGCAFSTALACELALGRDLLQAAKAAKRFVEAALRRAPTIGKGIGPVL